MPWTTVTDLRLTFERPIPDEDEQRVTELIAVAERRLTRLIPGIGARVTAGTLADADVVDVVRAAVQRQLRNPEGYRGEHSGDYGYYFGADSSDARTAPFTASELEALRTDTGLGSLGTIGVGTPLGSTEVRDLGGVSWVY